MHTWTFNLDSKPHKIEFWDSRISGKKKLSLDNNQLILTKDNDYFFYEFKIGRYHFTLSHLDSNTALSINGKIFNDLMREERSGLLNKEKKNNIEENNKLNQQNIYLDGVYDIAQQRALLEEFEKKKMKEKEKLKNFYVGNGNAQNDVNENKKSNKFILDDETVKKNRIIICNIQNIFEEGDDEESDLFDFTWDNNSNNNNNKMNNNISNKNICNYNIKNIGNNIKQINNNANNQHNQEIINQFFDFTQNNTNQQSNSNINNDYNKNKYDDDFNPFLD